MGKGTDSEVLGFSIKDDYIKTRRQRLNFKAEAFNATYDRWLTDVSYSGDDDIL